MTQVGTPAGRAPLQQLFVVVERGGARLRMRLVPIRNDGQHVAVANAALGVVPIEVLDGDARTLSEAYHVFRRLDLSSATTAGADRLTHAFAAWQEPLARAGIQLHLERRALYGAPLPHKHWQADTRGLSLRPWDVELTALVAGLRAIVKLDRVPPALVETLRQTAAERGLVVEVVTPPEAAAGANDPPESVTLLVGREASALVEARDLEATLIEAGEAWTVKAATLQMGALLGYPPCCVERFTRIAEQNDTTLAWAMLTGTSAPPASPTTQWLQPGLALLSHTPCALHCAPSVALGERIARAVEATEPGFDARWRALAARLQVVDRHGTRMAMAVDGALESGATVIAADLLSASSDDPDGERRTRRLVGRTVVAECGGLVAADDDWYAPYVADHRDRRPTDMGAPTA